MSIKQTSGRLHGLDVLRGVAMLLGVFLHGTISYKAGYHYGEWVIDEGFKSYFFDWLYLWINSFRMQVFFLLAGFFARLLIAKTGLHDFIKNRFKRIAIPFTLAYFTILPLTLGPYLYFKFMHEGGNTWEQLKLFYVQFFTFKETYGFMHLWFLQHLIIFYALLMGLFYIAPYGRPLFKRIATLFARPTVRLWQVTLMSIVIVWIIDQFFLAPLPSIWTGFLTPPVQIAYYGFFFLAGWILEARRDVFSSFDAGHVVFIVIGTLLSVVNLIVLNQFYAAGATDPLVRVLLKLGYSIQTILLVIGIIGLFNTRFTRPNGLWRYLSDSAYWVYLIHMPLVMIFQIMFLDSVVPGFLRYPLVVILSYGFSLLSYHYLVRFTWVGYLLNGKKFERSQSIFVGGAVKKSG